MNFNTMLQMLIDSKEGGLGGLGGMTPGVKGTETDGMMQGGGAGGGLYMDSSAYEAPLEGASWLEKLLQGDGGGANPYAVGGKQQVAQAPQLQMPAQQQRSQRKPEQLQINRYIQSLLGA